MKSIGILGAGQLSKFLVTQAHKMKIPVFVLSPSIQDPAAQNNDCWIQGDPHNVQDLFLFLQKINILTFESEFFLTSTIQKALNKLTTGSVHVAPSLNSLSLIQDRWTQKQLLSKYNISTSPFVKCHLKTQVPSQKSQLTNSSQIFMQKLWDRLGPFVLKTRRGGYDGYGTFIIKKKSQISKLQLDCTSFIAEKWIPFKRELAILAIRNAQQDVVFCPLVESFQKHAKCLWVKGPVKHKKLAALKKQIKIFLTQIKYEGLMAFELFDTGQDLLVNELAPRVHNSGHYSLDALNKNQFHLHLQAITNQKLQQPKLLKSAFAMYNLLGEAYKKPRLQKLPKSFVYLKDQDPLLFKGTTCYWYGKSPSVKGRKMGHVNATASTATQALNKTIKSRAYFKV